MKTIRLPYYSIGTIYGTVFSYDTAGNSTGSRYIGTAGIFFVVKSKWGANGTNLVNKSVGTGVSILTSLGTSVFAVTFASSDLYFPPGKYVFNAWANFGTNKAFSESDSLKSIGSGIFEVTEGAWYGTSH